MKVLIACSGNNKNFSPFINEQVTSLQKKGVLTDFFRISGSGIAGYLNNYKSLVKKIKEFKPDLIHAHYGHTGLLATLNGKIPVVITFHGSDINLIKNRKWSMIAVRLATQNILVSEQLALLIKARSYVVIPCGVDTTLFSPMDKMHAREQLGLEKEKKYILFSSSYENAIKNYPLAKAAIEVLNNPEVELLELKGYDRPQVRLLVNSADMGLMTSFSEGSPQFIKEIMSCNRPIVSTNVGDVEQLFGNEDGSYLCEFNPIDIAEKIKRALSQKTTIKLRQRIIDLGLDNELIADRLIKLYNQVLTQEHRKINVKDQY